MSLKKSWLKVAQKIAETIVQDNKKNNGPVTTGVGWIGAFVMMGVGVVHLSLRHNVPGRVVIQKLVVSATNVQQSTVQIKHSVMQPAKLVTVVVVVAMGYARRTSDNVEIA